MKLPEPEKLTADHVKQAHARIQPVIHRTPVLTCRSLNQLFNAELFFKCENFQKAGAFKFRGAANAVLSLPEKDVARGVASHSSGNHAQALALAAQLRKAKCTVVMPSNVTAVKKAAVLNYGAEITFCEPTLEAREEALRKVVAQTGAAVVHPFDDPNVIAGQGTAALELLQEVSALDGILVPVGGGGLLSGTALIAKANGVRVYGAEPVIANDAFLSFKEGRRYPSHNSMTVADGLRGALSDRTFSIVREKVDDIFVVQEDTIKSALRLILERMKIVVEPSSAVPLAALLEDKQKVAGRRFGIILSGGNLDLRELGND